MKVCKMECICTEETEEFFDERIEETERRYPESFEDLRNMVFVKIISRERNEKLLKEVPSQDVLDLSLVYYFFENHDPEGDEILITNRMLASWKLEPYELFQTAFFNTKNLLGQSIRPLHEMIEEMMQNMHLDLSLDHKEDSLPMYVLTNAWKRNGAVCMLFEDTLKEFANLVDSDLFVIPSSVHEVILVPSSQGVDRTSLDRIIFEVNRTELRPEDILSEHSYIYSRKAERIMV